MKFDNAQMIKMNKKICCLWSFRFPTDGLSLYIHNLLHNADQFSTVWWWEIMTVSGEFILTQDTYSTCHRILDLLIAPSEFY